ncbi:PanC Panthothenate synthetase [Candidatus Nanopelagicaceae bacterium]
MKVVTDARQLPSACAFVPTMGALHAGHASLFALAKKYSSDVVASIFVNPLQFESKEDLAQYPRTPDIDIAIAEAARVTHLWLPTQSEIYPEDYVRKSAGPMGDIYEGKSRPGHFDGVLTVVNRFFELLKPKVAIFGEKDFQQLQLIKTIAGDIEIITAPTIRENDGLALSSRNVRLTEEGRNAAQVIYRSLTQAKSESELREILATESALTVDYADFIDEKTFTHAHSDTREVRAIVAGWINGVRLIDNMPMGNRA